MFCVNSRNMYAKCPDESGLAKINFCIIKTETSRTSECGAVDELIQLHVASVASAQILRELTVYARTERFCMKGRGSWVERSRVRIHVSFQ